MSEILIIAGDRGRARILSLDHDTDEMRELADMVNPTVHLHERQLSGDRQGRGFNRFRASRVALGNAHPHKRLSSMRFARQVAEAVEGRCKQRRYLHIYLLADPEFIGLLRPQLAAKDFTGDLQVISKNVTGRDTATIRGYLPAHLWRRPLSDAGT